MDILKGFQSEVVDLIYLDPPFNSKADYNVLFRTPSGQEAESQILAFEDTWHWGSASESYYDKLLNVEPRIASVMRGLVDALGKNDMTAYLVMMAIRLVELHRVLKDTGSIFLHCDPVASHYLKIVLDAIFTAENFRNEIIWKRTNSTKEQTKMLGRQHDVIFWFSRSGKYTYNKVGKTVDSKSQKPFRYDDEDGKGLYRLIPLSNTTESGGFAKMKTWEWRGVTARWIYSKKKLEEWWDAGLIVKTKGGLYNKKAYWSEKEAKGDIVTDIWTDSDVAPIQSKEKLGYPTQKPVSLLERIIKTSSKEGDTILDPFCGCGTAIEAAQKLGRHWIGIDMTHLAIGLIEKRILDAFGIRVDVKGTPQDLEGARDLARRNKLQFEHWAVMRIPNMKPNKRQVGDRGVDGTGYIRLDKTTAKVVVSVKGGDNVTPSMVRDLGGTMEVEGANFGILVLLVEPTRKMIEAAAKYGQFTTPMGNSYDKLQIWTIPDYFKGIPPRLPSLYDYGKAPRSKTANQDIQTTFTPSTAGL